MYDELSAESDIGINTFKKTLAEYKLSGMIIPTVRDKIDDFNKNEIRQKIHNSWLRLEIPTLPKMIQAIKDDPSLPDLSHSSFQRLLKT